MKLIYLIAAVMISGCASVSEIERGFGKVDISDGISADEAKAIAKKFLLRHHDRDRYCVSFAEADNAVFSPFAHVKGRAWVISFISKSTDIFGAYCGRTFVVGVDKSSGNVLFYENGHATGATPFEANNYGDEGIPVGSIPPADFWVFDFDGRVWKLDGFSPKEDSYRRDYVLFNESLDNWTETVTSIRQAIGAGETVESFADSYKQQINNGCVGLEWKVLDRSDANGMLFEWSRSGCERAPDRYELKRVVRSGKYFYILSYTSGSGRIPEPERLSWIRSIRAARLR